MYTNYITCIVCIISHDPDRIVVFNYHNSYYTIYLAHYYRYDYVCVVYILNNNLQFSKEYTYLEKRLTYEVHKKWWPCKRKL